MTAHSHHPPSSFSNISGQQARFRPESIEHAHTSDTLDTETLLNATGSLIVVLNRQGKIKRFNRTCETLTGYCEADVKGKGLWDVLIPQEERSAMQGLFQHLLNGQTNSYYECTWIGKGGDRHVIAWSNTVITQRLGRVEFVVASGIEVTEQRRHLRQLEGLYRQSHLLTEITQKVRQSIELEDILQTTVTEVQGLLGCDRVFILHATDPHPPPTEITSENSTAAPTVDEPIVLAAYACAASPTVSALPGEALLKKQWPHNPLLTRSYLKHYQQQSVSVLYPGAGPGTDTHLEDILNRFGVRSELAVPILIRETKTDTFWGLLVAHHCGTQSSKPVRQWSPLEIDLMQQLANQIGVAIHHAELLDNLETIVAERTAKLTTTNQQLAYEVEGHYRTGSALRRSEQQLKLITNALPALVAYIDSRHRYRFNNYAYETWYNIPYQQIKGRQISEIVSLEVYQHLLPHLEQAMGGEEVTFETEMVKASGDRLWVSISYIPDIQSGQVKGLFSLVSDISDRKATERMKDEFLSVVSHELRTPLTSVHGSLQLIATGKLGQLNATGQELIDIAISNTARLSRLLNDILDLERMGSGKVSMAPAKCLASDLIGSAIETMQTMADDYGITLTADTTPLPVWADPDHILQTLTNLLSNAIKFSPRDSSVLVSAYTSPTNHKNVEFSVKDQGRGIPTEKLETIFERFAQVDSSDARKRGGTGLGLAICREIVQQHNGRIWVKSIHGQGSTFYFTLFKPTASTPATSIPPTRSDTLPPTDNSLQ